MGVGSASVEGALGEIDFLFACGAGMGLLELIGEDLLLLTAAGALTGE